MEVGSPEWIETSLARLDELESSRGQLESELESIDDPAALASKSKELDALDAELKSLYAQLEAIAADDDDDDEEEEENIPGGATQGDDELSAPHSVAMAAAAAGAGSAPLQAAPAEAPAPAPAAVPAETPLSTPAADPFGSPSPAPSTGFDAPAAAYDDSDLKPQGANGKWFFLGFVALVGLGIGGFFAFQNMQKNKADTKPVEAGEVQVIKAADVPDDTEAPPTAPSGTAVVSPNGAADDSSTKKKKKKTEDKKKTIKLNSGDAPLGGL